MNRRDALQGSEHLPQRNAPERRTQPKCEFVPWHADALARQPGTASAASLANDFDGESRVLGSRPTAHQHPLTSYGFPSTPSRGCRQPGLSPLGTGPREGGAAAAGGSDWSMRPTDEFLDDSDDFGDMDSDEERELADLTDRSAQKAATASATPATPATLGAAADAAAPLITPSVARTLFPSASIKKQRTTATPLGQPPPPSTGPTMPPTPATTPGSISGRAQKQLQLSSVRGRDDGPNDRDGDYEGDSTTARVMHLLKDQRCSPDVARQVLDTLQTASRRARGIAKGRDVSRAELARKDQETAQLRNRVTELENQVAAYKQHITNLKSDLMRVYRAN